MKLFAKLQAAQKELGDLASEHSNERQGLEETQNELTREVKLKFVQQRCHIRCIIIYYM